MSGQYDPTEMKILVVEVAIRTATAICSSEPWSQSAPHVTLVRGTSQIVVRRAVV